MRFLLFSPAPSADNAEVKSFKAHPSRCPSNANFFRRYGRSTCPAGESGFERDLVETTRALTVALDKEFESSISALKRLATSEHLGIGDMIGFYDVTSHEQITVMKLTAFGAALNCHAQRHRSLESGKDHVEQKGIENR